MFKKTLFVIFIAALLAGCNSHHELLPFLGKWSGKFEVSSIEGDGTAIDKKREQLNGFVQVYATHQKYKMEMEGEQEVIKIEGTWTQKGNRITLKPLSMLIDDRGGADKRDPNKKYIPSVTVHDAYQHPLILVEAKDKKSLTGLEMSIGTLIGTHRFVKDSF